MRIRTLTCLLLVIILSVFTATVFSEAISKNVTLTEQQVINHANKVKGSYYTKGYCLEWVATKFWQALGGPYSSSCCAYNYGSSRIVSTSKNNIPIGADIFFSGGSTKCRNNHTAGHIGVYIGDGKVINLIRYSSDPAGKAMVRTNTISQIEGWGYKYRGWGYHTGIKMQTDYSVTVTNDGNGTAFASPTSGKTGTEVTLTAKPNSGYQFSKWEVISGGVTISNNKFKIGSSNVKIKAIFTKIPTYSVTVTTDGNGTASASPTSGIAGTVVSLSATPGSGYRFGYWSVISGGISISNNRFTIGNSDITVKAIFEKLPPTISLPGTVVVEMGNKAYLNASLSDGGKINFSTSDSKIVMVSEDGYIYGCRPGAVTVTATAASNSNISASCAVTVGIPNGQFNQLSLNNPLSCTCGGNSYAVIAEFVPEKSGYYLFESIDTGYDTFGYVFNSSWECLSADDDSGGNHQFKLNNYYVEGQKYYHVARMFNPFRDEGTVALQLTQSHGDDEIEINSTNFPDDIFREYVRIFDYNGNGFLSIGDISNAVTIDIHEKGIASIQGIEYFTALQTMDCSQNSLSTMDVSQNTALKWLTCNNNSLASLDVSRNTSLEILLCGNNQLTALDVSNNPKLTDIRCWNNQIASLDLRNNPELSILECHGNQITTLNTSGNPKLQYLDCLNNKLSLLNVSACTKLQSLDCSWNELTDLDISINAELSTLRCTKNQLTDLNVRENKNLRVLGCGDNQLTAIDVSNNANLIEFGCSGNGLTQLDISKNTRLIVLSCSDNQLGELNLSNNSDLQQLFCYRNPMTDLDISNNPHLIRLLDETNPEEIEGTFYNWKKDADQNDYGYCLYVDKTLQIFTGNEPQAESVELKPKKKTLYRTSDNPNPVLILTAVITPSNADETLEWTSSNPKVAWVDEDGTVTALGKGTAIITCMTTDGSDLEATCKITVKNQLVKGLKLDKKKVTLKKGETVILNVDTITPNDAFNQEVKWTTTNRKVATVDKNGKVTAKGKGTCYIKCSATDGSKITAKCKITVKSNSVKSITLNKTKGTLKIGKTLKLRITAVVPEEIKDPAVKWSSSDEKVAIVDKDGKVAAVGKGNCDIICTALDGSETFIKCRIKVR